MASGSKVQPSVWNWMGTILLTCIPGVNLIFFIVSVIACRSTAKRRYCVAGIVLTLLLLIIYCVLAAVFPQFFTDLAARMRMAVTGI